MNNTENPNFEESQGALSSAEPAKPSSAEQEQNQDLNLDELYSLLGDSFSNKEPSDDKGSESEDFSTEATKDDSSVMAELEAMYSSLDLDADAGGSVSVMEELEAMYGDSDESEVTGVNISSDNDGESDSSPVSVMDELEAMYGSFSDSNTTNQNYDADDTSALTALEALMGDSAESATEDALSDSSYESLFENRRSVLDELQNLLQSSIEELDASAEHHVNDTLLSMSVEYPSRSELKALLEEKLSQLMMLSDDSENMSFDASTSVLEELNALMKETGSSIETQAAYSPSSQISAESEVENSSITSEEIDAYIASISSDYEVPAEDSIAEEQEIIPSISANTEKVDQATVLHDLETYLAETSITLADSDFAQPETDVLTETVKPDSNEINHAEKKEQPAKVYENRVRKQTLSIEAPVLEEMEENKSLSLWYFLLIFVVIGTFVGWYFSDQNADVIKPVTPTVSPVSQSLPEKTVAKVTLEKNENTSESKSLKDLLASFESSRTEQVTSYDEPNSTPQQSYVYEEDEVLEVEPPVQRMTPAFAESVTEEISGEIPSAENVSAWVVHLFAYYNEPPVASELEFLKVVGVPYEIKQARVNGQLWYRVQVVRHSEFYAVKEYAAMLATSYGIRGVWISKQDQDQEEAE